MLALQRSRRLTSLVRRHSTATHVLQHATLLTERPRMEELVLVRHGESEGNVAYQRSLDGDHSLYSGEFLKRHSSLWRLTDRGREQAGAAGQWLRTQVDCRFDAFFTSEYLRAMETASLLQIPRALAAGGDVPRARLGRLRLGLAPHPQHDLRSAGAAEKARLHLLGAAGRREPRARVRRSQPPNGPWLRATPDARLRRAAGSSASTR